MDDLLVALRMIVALAAVLGLLLFLSRRLQKGAAKGGNPLSGLVPSRVRRMPVRTPGSRSARSRPERITVVARSGLGGKAQLVIAEFGGIRYVLGVTEHGISVVDTQEAPAPVDEEEPDAEDTEFGGIDDLPLKSVA